MDFTLNEAKNIITFMIENNRRLEEKNEKPIAINLLGHCGIGKTAIAKQIAEEMDANFIFLSLAQITDPAELCGWPIKEHYVCRNDECTWITAELIEAYTKAGYTMTDETRMSYAVPMWVKNLDPNKPTICVFDDFTRANNAILQSAMSIILEQEYISWKLPKNTTIILTTNPEEEYNVNYMDDAQRSRFITLNIVFDKSNWAKYAEEKEIDNRAINFMLFYADELMNRGNAKTARINARNYTMFANIIAGIDDWSKQENLALIMQFASSCFNDSDDVVGSLFTSFIANKLDQLLSPEDMINLKWETVKSKLESQVYTNDVYRADIASILTTRLINYSLVNFAKQGFKTELIINRIIDIVDRKEDEPVIFTEDLIFNLIKTLHNKFPGKCNKLLLNMKVAQKLL